MSGEQQERGREQAKGEGGAVGGEQEEGGDEQGEEAGGGAVGGEQGEEEREEEEREEGRGEGRGWRGLRFLRGSSSMAGMISKEEDDAVEDALVGEALGKAQQDLERREPPEDF